MDIYVNGVKFAGGIVDDECLKSLLVAINKVPLTPIAEKAGVNIIAGLEGEVAQCADSHGVELGTENIQNCMALYLYGGGRRFLVHVNDYYADLQLDKYLERFPVDSPVNAIIVGGRLSFAEHSSLNLIHIVKSLLRAKRNITIVSHRILEPAPKDTTARNELMLDSLMMNFKMLYLRLFSENIPNELLLKVKPTDFEIERHRYLDDASFHNILKMVLTMVPLMKESDHHAFERMRLLKFFEKFSHKMFEVIMLEAISKRGMNWLEAEKKVEHIDQYKNCTNFFFWHDIDGSVKVSKMGLHQEKAFESERKIYLYLDGTSNRISHYFDAYVDGQYIKPTITQEVSDKIAGIKNLLEAGASVQSTASISALCPFVKGYHFHFVADAFIRYNPPAQINNAPENVVVFSYKQSEFKSESENTTAKRQKLDSNS